MVALSGEKILVTGAAGSIGLPLVEHVARENEVWGVARFGDPAAREKVEATGATTRSVDLASGDLDELPDDFTYVVHLAVMQGPGLDYDQAIRVNAEGTGLLLQHCRRARAALVMSTHSVYKPHEDPRHVFAETDALGDANALHSPTYSVSKIGQEAVARYCARAFDLPVVIARMNASYSTHAGLPTLHLENVLAGEPVVTRWDPCPYSPIHQDDIDAQTAALLDAAGVPATIVNWAGDEAVSVQEWCAHVARLVGSEADVVVREVPGTLRGSIADNTRRTTLTGPCTVDWREGLRRIVGERFPDRLVPAVGGGR
jgi:nucleoside-diphosphate-sugar epimerase